MTENTAIPAYAPILVWCRLSGMSRSGTYISLGRGELRGKKIGARTVIDVAAGLAWIAGLADATIRAPRGA